MRIVEFCIAFEFFLAIVSLPNKHMEAAKSIAEK